jgi:streptogramin lyase
MQIRSRPLHAWLLGAAFALFFGMAYLVAASASDASPMVTTYPIPTHSSGAFFIAAGPDDSVWFTEIDANKIGRIAKDGTVTEFPLPHPASEPARIVEGADGAMWFVEYAGDRIGRITAAGALREYAIPTQASGPYGLAAGPNGSIWFTEQNAHGIGEITPAGDVREFRLPSRGPDKCPIAPAGIARDGNGGFWAMDLAARHFWRIDLDGRMLDFRPQWPASVLASTRDGVSQVCNWEPPAGSLPASGIAPSPPDIYENAQLLNHASLIVPVKPGQFAIATVGWGSYALGDPAKRLNRVQVGWGGPVTDVAAGAGMVAFTDIGGQVAWTFKSKTAVYNVLVRAKPAGIAIAQDGNIWVCAYGFNTIMKIRP